MKNINASGYLVLASDLTKLLPKDKQPQYETLLAAHDWDGTGDYLATHLPEHLPMPEEIFLMSTDIETDDPTLQRGVLYAQYAESDLFERKPTLLMSNLMVEGITPTNRRWVEFG